MSWYVVVRKILTALQICIIELLLETESFYHNTTLHFLLITKKFSLESQVLVSSLTETFHW